MKQQVIDSKANPSATGEADDCLFEYLHAELVNYVLSKSTNAAVSDEYIVQSCSHISYHLL